MAEQQTITDTPARQLTARAIVLSNGMAAIVDETDFDSVSRYYWHAHPRPDGNGHYVRGLVDGHKVLMHVFLLGKQDGLQIDHANGNGLDNRRDNLRRATQSQNQRNIRGGRGRSLYKGVSWARRQRKWMATICYDGRNHHIGYYDQEDAAARAYDREARKHFGEFACPNFSEVDRG